MLFWTSRKASPFVDANTFPAEECEELLVWYLLHCGAEDEALMLLNESQRKHDLPASCSYSLLLPTLVEAGRQWQSDLLSAMTGSDVSVPYTERAVHDLVPCSDEERDASSSDSDSNSSLEAIPTYLLSCDEHMVCLVRWHPEGKFIAASCMEEGVRVWNLRERQFIEWPLSPDSIVPETSSQVFQVQDNCRPQYVSLCWSNEGKKFAVGMPNGFVIVRHDNGSMFSSYGLHKGIILDMCFSPSDTYLLSVASDCICYVFEVATGEPIQRCTGHLDEVTCCVWNGNEAFVTGGSDGFILLWHVDAGDPIKKLSKHRARVNSIALTSCGELLASGSEDRTVKLWSLKDGRYVCDLHTHDSSVCAVVSNPAAMDTTSFHLASCSADCTICLYDVRQRMCLQRLVTHRGQVCTVDFTRDGQLLASGDFVGILYVWDLKTMTVLLKYDANTMDGGTITSVQWNHDGSRLAVGTQRGKVAILLR